MGRFSRRQLLTAAGAMAFSAACSSGKATGPGERLTTPMLAGDGLPDTPTATPFRPTPAPTATQTPVPVRTTGVSQRTLMGDTPWATRLSIRSSGVRGPAVMVLGGVHGNEPGGWTAAETVADWAPAAGELLVVPRANITAIPAFARTFEEIGDLNRLYPGDSNSPLAMERLAAEIVATAREFNVDVLLDMHESWAFFAEYAPGAGTGALGQTITAGVGPRQATIAKEIADRVNPLITSRETMLVRNGNQFQRPTTTPAAGQTNRGRSSLSIGGHVPGLTPILVEMGQENQAQGRRVHLHLTVAEALLRILGVLG